MRHGWCPVLIVACLGWNPAPAAEPAPTPQQVRFFEGRIRPLFAAHCFRCHGPEKQRADLRLDTPEDFHTGGHSGPPVVAGKPAESLLIRAVTRTDPDKRMPRGGELTKTQIADLKRWVEMGAPYPTTPKVAGTTAAGKDHWAFRPMQHPPIPKVKDPSWAQTPVDNFLLARLEAKGLRPAARADRHTLIRRVTFDLTGLPPTPDEVEAFVHDRSPDAWAKVVERLLGSPAYGERWGRHWLDVARYSDSNGLDENIAHGNAWRYRDHVVAMFNADQPYDQFVREQLAGDLLPSDDQATRTSHWIATGFLSMGPKVLAEVDERKMEMDIVDEQISTVGRAFLGLTLGCARCHDHKFDPIPTADYYALAGIFKSTRTMDSFKKIARWHEYVLPTEEARRNEAEVARVKKAIADLEGQKKAAAELKKLRAELTKLEKARDELPSAMGVTDGNVADVPIHLRGSHLRLGRTVPRHFPVVLAGEDQPALPAGESGRLELANWLTGPEHPLTARVMVNRIWRWHFGTGLVPTPDNFGRLGERPTHPQLLDWLARRFIADGWSVKSLHRLILLSSAYQMDGVPVAGSARADPQNRLYSRFPLQRLESEEVRDSLLAVAGLLHREMGGSLLQVKNRAFFFDHTSKDTTRYDSPRRALYLPVVRNHLYDVFQLFDSTDAAVPDGDRSTTTVAPQALFMMNAELVQKASEALARDLLRGERSDEARIQDLYLRAYGRPATAHEVERLQGLLARLEGTLAGPEKERAWALVCQVVLAANEFIYIR